MKVFPMTSELWDTIRSSADRDDHAGVVVGSFILVFIPILEIFGWIVGPPLRLIGRALSAIFRHRF